ncbi:MAG: hypothetical protein JO219_08105 [Candidatus Eremiobacteraeota bacterium]|nr:hypothetical protein [Candidatus Eremiobacteraeota bacterium]MBV8367236.1 hypothetical protein [Candidatus Eremiobacteraeota bacterium]
MSLELLNTLATFGTFLVITATAIAALVQLRHARGSNQIAALKELNDESSSPKFTDAEVLVRSELAARIKDPEFRYQVAHPTATSRENQALRMAARDIGNYYETMGLLVRTELIDRELALNLWSRTAVAAWEWLATYAAIIREERSDAVWENFEYFVVLSENWIASHPRGAYPPHLRRILLQNEYRDEDKRYAASRSVG